jgi:hypothetical protein
MDNLFKIKDIAPPVETLPGTTLWPWIGAALIFSALLLYIFRRKTQTVKSAEPPAPPFSPLQTALKALEFMLSENLIENGETKLFFTRLNIILRIFLKEISKLPVTAQTSSELILSDGLTAEMSDTAKRSFAAFLQKCDLFKFADIEAMPDIARSAHKACRNLITTIADERGAK